MLLSVVSVETGKTITKSSKAVVRNGSCQWIKTVSESVWVSQEASSKELDDCLFKFIVSIVLLFFLLYLCLQFLVSFIIDKTYCFVLVTFDPKGNVHSVSDYYLECRECNFSWLSCHRDQLDLISLERLRSM